MSEHSNTKQYSKSKIKPNFKSKTRYKLKKMSHVNKQIDKNNQNDSNEADNLDTESNTKLNTESNIDLNIDLNINEILDREISYLLNRDIKRERDILVLSGGSTKGVAQIGALHCLKKNNMLKHIKTIAATSAGSMIGLLYCAGYHPIELYKFIKLIDLEMVKKLDAQNVITKYGLDDGTRMMFVLKKMLVAKGFNEDISFINFYRRTNITFIVTGACINDKKPYYFSHMTYPDMQVMEAIRISISIPIVFTPYIHEGKIFVDGGCIDNFPIQLFNNDLDRVIGIYVTETRKVVNEIKYIEDYISNIIQCLFEGMAHRDTLNHNHNRYVIVIRCSQAGETPTDLTHMFDEGYLAAQDKLDSGELF